MLDADDERANEMTHVFLQSLGWRTAPSWSTARKFRLKLTPKYDIGGAPRKPGSRAALHPRCGAGASGRRETGRGAKAFERAKIAASVVA